MADGSSSSADDVSIAWKVHRQLIIVNPRLIAADLCQIQNQPMLDIKNPPDFPDFKTWLTAVCEPRGMQKAIADATHCEPQAVTKWLNGGKVSTVKLKLLAAHVGVDYGVLRLLLDGVRNVSALKSEWPLPKTQLGANVGRKWEELNEPAKTQILDVLETLLTLQRSTYREYAAKQQEIAANRQRTKPREKI